MTETWTPEQYQAFLATPPKKRSKYGSRKHEVDGIEFHSEKEARHYGQLKIRLLAGEITNLELQPTFEITIGGKKVFKYIADFRYLVDGVPIVVDVKSPATRKKETYRLKKKAVEAQYGIKIIEA